ncbi:nuclear transport factor 2 family protein [Sporichthya sp.]|uniref:nuclear transport factor 2 family protein n=1 Tax=Sporichthya sp. TaxID=65475 RepID=UPI0017CE6735|nr:nuclear transport factor 2 family protein [Sporichthya sp.]MBA3744155.1 nuclear transport factor 2 family protein [Sporichthya sp.]
MTTLVHRFLTAHNGRDLEAVLDCFTDDVDYRDLFFGDFHGRDALRAMFERTFVESAEHYWTVTRAVATPDAIVAEWEFDYTVADSVPSGGGTRLLLPGVSWLELRGGRCFRYREFFDRAATLHAQGIAPAKVAAIVARRSTVRILQPESAMLPS